jgi:hypothetical protein
VTTTVEHQAQPQQEQPAQAPPVEVKPKRRPPKKLLAIVAGVMVAAVAVFFAVSALTGDETVEGPNKDNAFKLVLPSSWRAFSKEELAKAPGKPLAVLRRKDGKGFLVVRRSGRLPANLNAFAGQLDKEFKSRFKDFQRQSAKTVEVRAGKAFFYSYIRKSNGTVNSVTIVPAPKGTFTLNGVSKGGEKDVARELGRMIVSFDT